MAGSSLVAALFVNFAIGVVKGIVGLFTGSSAMLAESLHSFADTFNQILLALGIKTSKKNPDLEHPFGYSKNQFFWAFIVAVLIFGVSGTLAFLEGLNIILNPAEHEIHEDLMGWNILVLLIAIALEGFAFRTAFKEAKEFQEKLHTPSIREALDEMQDPVLLSLLTEDSLALIGLVIALIGVGFTMWLKAPIIDGITSLAIGIILIIGGILLAIENKTYLIGRGISSRVQQQIREIVLAHEGITEIITLKSLLLGTDDLLLVLDVQYSPTAEDTLDLAASIDALEQKLVASIPRLSPSKIFIEIQ